VRRRHIQKDDPLFPRRSGRRYRGAADIERAADLHVQGSTLRQIDAELAVRVSGVRCSLPGSIFGHAGAHSTRTRPNLAIT
jgi:hypothetical protein